jgi:hypothetical protein
MDAWWRPRNLFRAENAGLLLDVTVFLANLLVMDPLLRLLLAVIRRADAGDGAAMAALAAFAVALFVLQPLGAVLKRHAFHRRAQAVVQQARSAAGGCLFSPIFHWVLQVVVFFTAAALLAELAGADTRDSAGLFFSILFGGIVLVTTNTVLVYRYFSPPTRPPRPAWLGTPAAERLGDVSLFANMLCFQVFWNLLAGMQAAPVGSVGEFVGRLFWLVFLALLLYFPPRMLYLAEDIGRVRTWIGMTIANSVVLWRVLIGTD